MQTEKTTHLSGIERVKNFDTDVRIVKQVWLTNFDVAVLLKKKFYFMQVKMTSARHGKQIAVDDALDKLKQFVTQSQAWVNTQNQVITNFEQDCYDVMLISPYGAKLLKAITGFDQVMSDLAGAQFAGGQAESLRTNYLGGFKSHFFNLLEVAKRSDLQFHKNGDIRNAFQSH